MSGAKSTAAVLAMKLVLGQSLREELAALPTWKGRLALVLRLIAVTDVLACAHDPGIIQRDPPTPERRRAGRVAGHLASPRCDRPSA